MLQYLSNYRRKLWTSCYKNQRGHWVHDDRSFDEEFIVLRQIGQSNHTVYVARDSRGDRFACKEFVHAQNKIAAREQVLHEIEFAIAAVCNYSPYLVWPYFFFPGKNRDVIVMKYFEEGNLQTYIRRLRAAACLPDEDTVWLAMFCIASALRDMHSLGWVHGDLKPGNVFLSSSSLVLGDFDFAQRVPNNDKLDEQAGTKGYQAPEVIEENWDFKADIWSLGCVLYELCVPGGRFIDNEDWTDFEKFDIRGHVEMKAGPLRKIYSGQLVDILEECLSACPEDRPAACLLRNTARRQLGSRLVDPHPPHLEIPKPMRRSGKACLDRMTKSLSQRVHEAPI